MGILLFVSLISYLRARAVREYPPVMAFRKGIGTHHFGKNRLPLRKAGKNVHLRLAMKGFLMDMRHSVGLFVCVAVSASAIMEKMNGELICSCRGDGLTVTLMILLS